MALVLSDSPKNTTGPHAICLIIAEARRKRHQKTWQDNHNRLSYTSYVLWSNGLGHWVLPCSYSWKKVSFKNYLPLSSRPSDVTNLWKESQRWLYLFLLFSFLQQKYARKNPKGQRRYGNLCYTNVVVHVTFLFVETHALLSASFEKGRLLLKTRGPKMQALIAHQQNEEETKNSLWSFWVVRARLLGSVPINNSD